MRLDLRRLSSEVTALSHTDADVALDRTSLLAYLEGANARTLAAGPIAKAAISEAYVAEYGLEPDEQSCLNFLLFIHADRRSKFTPFGVFSDERYHVVDGNDRIVEGLTQALPRPVEFGMRLVAVRRTPAGRVELTFDTAGGPVSRTHDAVVLAIPFSSLRNVDLDVSLGLVSREARGDRPARLRDERQDDGRLRAPALDCAGQQRRVVLGSRESPDHVGNQPRDGRRPLAAC